MSLILKILNLTKKFGGVKAVDNVSLNISKGELIGIIGPNGAGKTTLVNLITGFIKPDSGTIIFDGKDITGLPPYKIARLGVVRTFQLVRTFGDDPIRNVLLGLLKRKEFYGSYEVEAIDILEETGFDRRDKDIYMPLKSQPYGNLKRIELARAISLKPKLLLLDEPFSGLHREEVSSIIPLIARLNNEGLTIVIIEHRVGELAALVNRLIVMNEGQVIADGNPSLVVKDEKVMKAYFGEARAT